MKDMQGKTIRVGDVVEYLIGGREHSKEHGLFIVKAIKTDNSEIPKYASNAESRDTAPYAILFDTQENKLLAPPFFPYEILKPEIEDLI